MTSPLIRVGANELLVKNTTIEVSAQNEPSALIFFDQAPQHPKSIRDLLALLDSCGLQARRILTIFDLDQAEEIIRNEDLKGNCILAVFYFAKSPLSDALLPLSHTLWEHFSQTPLFVGFTESLPSYMAEFIPHTDFQHLKILSLPLSVEILSEAKDVIDVLSAERQQNKGTVFSDYQRKEIAYLQILQEEFLRYRKNSPSSPIAPMLERIRWESAVPDLLTSAGHGLIFLNSERCIKEMNAPMEKMLSCALDHCRNAKIATFFHPPAFSERFFQQLLAEHSICEFEVHPKIEKSDIKHLLLDAKVVQNHGKITGYILLFRNRTAQFKIQDTLEEQTEILRQSGDAIFVLDLHHCVTFWNFAAENLYGIIADQALGRPVPSAVRLDSDAFAQAYNECMSTGKWSGEMRQSNTVGDHLLIRSRWSLVRDRRENPKALVVINTDITDHRAQQETDLRSQRLESIGAMAGGIAHDLNNILHPISLSLQILSDNIVDAESRRILDTVTTSMERASQMIRQILSFARGIEAEWSKLYVEDFLGDVEHFVRIAFPKNIHFECAGPARSIPLLGNPTHLYQALLNICINARDAMPDGGSLSIKVKNVHRTLLPTEAPVPPNPNLLRTDEFVHITVTDSGVGIPADLQTKILEPYFSTKPMEKGTGLGLATTHDIIRKHGGVLAIDSVLGKGASFHFYLPALLETASPPVKKPILPVVPEAPVVVPVSPLVVKKQTASIVIDPKKATARITPNVSNILLVDDEPAVLMVLKIALEKSGYRVIEARNGVEALEKFHAHRSEIHIIITDIAMPGMSGLDLIQAIREEDTNTPIIATTGMNTPSQMEAIRAQGANRILSKPCGSRILLDTLKSLQADL